MSRRGYIGSWVGLSALILLAGCNDSEDISCGEGTELQAGKCIATEDGAGDAGMTSNCGDGTFEVDGECVPLGSIGQACTSSDQCESGACLKEKDGSPGGYCTQLSCGTSRPCASGSHCMYSSAKDANLCLATCDDKSGCREGYVCQPLYISDHTVCIPDCRVSDLCSTSTTCDESDGVCKPTGCDPKEENTCGEGRLCAPNRLGVGDSAGLCLPGCGDDKPCGGADVCQPITDDPTGPGVCVTSSCDADAECPAGARCVDHICMPPNRCDDEGECDEEGTQCVGGPGGKCMPACPGEDEGTCSDLHSGLICAEPVGACLPLGEFPGSPCRPDKNSACGAVTTSAGAAALTCIEEQCLVSCGDSADVCAAVSDTLVCAEGVLSEDVCLPKGSFPGGPCAEDDACQALALDSGNAPMACLEGTCTVTCDAADEGDIFCAAIDASLVCAEGVGPMGTDTCLPRGSFPGGPCAPGGECNDGMFCSPDDICLTDCSTGGDTLCSAIRADLFCATDVFATEACLPKGSFPGAPCDSQGACEDVVIPSGEVPMACVQDRCLITCAPNAEGNGFCGTFDSSLTCAQLSATVAACVPKGTFPGGPCAADNTCTGQPDMACVQDRCLVTCDPNAGGDTFCGMLDDTLACAQLSQTVAACVPKGTFAGGPCASDSTCTGEPNLVCYGDSCGIGCDADADGDATCTAIGTQLGTTFSGCGDPAPLGIDICVPAAN